MQNMGVSNKAELRHLMTLFAGCPPPWRDAHRLSALVFGSQQCRHFIRNAERETERIDLSTYEEPPLDYALQPRLRTYKPRMDRSGFADKSAERRPSGRKSWRKSAAFGEKTLHYVHEGRLISLP